MTLTLTDQVTPYGLLRAPEAELFRKPETAKLLQDGGQFDIRRPMAPFAVAETPDWAADPHKDKTWRLYFHSLYWLHGLYYTANVAQSEAPALEKRAADLVMSYVHFLDSLDEDATTSGPLDCVWDDHATSYRTSHVAYVYSRSLQGRLDATDAAAMARFAERHIDQLKIFLDSDKWRYSNHTLFQIEGLIDAAMTFVDGAERNALVRFALDHYIAWVNRIVITDEGTVREHAAFYHVFLMARIRDFNAYVETLLGPGQLPDIDKVLQRMAKVFWTMCVDKTHVPGIGDTKFNMTIAQKYIDPFLKAPYATPMCTWLQTKGAEGRNRNGLTRYPKAGHYFIRQGGRGRELLTAFQDKPFIGPHGHADGLGFETFWRGRCLLADSGGPFKYGTQMRYRYFQKPIAHNVVVLGDGQQRYTSEVQYAASKAGVSVIKGHAQITDQTRWVRGIAQLRNHYLVVADLLDGPVDDGAYARFQPGIDIDVTEVAGGQRRLHPKGTGQLATAQALFLTDGFGHTAHPDKVSQSPQSVPHNGQNLSLHDRAYLTHADGHFTTVTPIRIPMTRQSLLVSIFAFGAPVAVERSSAEGQHQLVLRHPDFDAAYEVTLTDRLVEGQPAGFALTARIQE